MQTQTNTKAADLQSGIMSAYPSAFEVRATGPSILVKLTSKSEANALYTLVAREMAHANIRERAGHWIVNGRA